MAKKKFDPQDYDKKHKANLAARAKKIKDLYDNAARKAVQIALASGFNDPDKEFIVEKHPAVKKRIDDMLDNMHDNLYDFIKDEEEKEWHLANAKNDAMIDSIAARTTIARGLIEQWKLPNLTALAAFQDRKVKGMGLSDRVWNLTDQLKGELELALEMGIGSGKSAADISRDVRQYLNEPNKLFRRVRDEKGILRLSKAAAAYHPGRGVYRSSYKNALRMTATETNMAYRSADHERWQQIPFVIGIEIHLSNNHTIKNSKGESVDFFDICDELEGTYPKDFKFVGWHPNCRCVAVAKMCSDEEFIKYNQKILAGEDVSDFKFSGKVEELPDNFKKWVEKNQERITKAKSVPYFLKDNAGIINKANPKAGIGDFYETNESKRLANEAYGNHANLQKARLTDKQKRNVEEIAELINVEKGNPMNFWEADQGRGNVNYREAGAEFKENCINSVLAHELRIRGLDVTALAKVNVGESQLLKDIAENPHKLFVNPTPRIIGNNGMLNRKMLDNATREIGRYHLSWDIEGFNEGHVITAERLKDGSLVLYDPQSSTFWGNGFLGSVSKSGIKVIRVDGLEIRSDLTPLFVGDREKSKISSRKAKHHRRR